MSATLIINIHNGTGDIHAGTENNVTLPASQWQIVSREPAMLQLSEPERARLFAPDVAQRADEIYGERPYRLTLQQRREIADEIDGGSNH